MVIQRMPIASRRAGGARPGRPAESLIDRAPPLTQLTAEGTGVVGGVVATLIAAGLVVGALRLPAWVALAATVCPWVLVLAARSVFDRLREPVVRISSATLRPGQAALVYCELRAKRAATVRRVLVGLECQESYGESSQTDSYGEWALLPGPRRVGIAPVALRRRLQAPAAPRERRWSSSRVAWRLTLRVEVDGGLTVRRSYPIDLVVPAPDPQRRASASVAGLLGFALRQLAWVARRGSDAASAARSGDGATAARSGSVGAGPAGGWTRCPAAEGKDAGANASRG